MKLSEIITPYRFRQLAKYITMYDEKLGLTGTEVQDDLCKFADALEETESKDTSFKKQLINDLIPRIEAMKEKEKLHLHWLIDNDAPMDFIQLSQKYYNHFTQRIEEYKEYAERL